MAVLAGAGEPVPPSVVTDRMIVTRPAVTGILGTLEKRGLVARTAHGSDARMHFVGLTANGQELVSRVPTEVHRFENDLFGLLGEGQLATLLRMLWTHTPTPRHGGSRRSRARGLTLELA